MPTTNTAPIAAMAEGIRRRVLAHALRRDGGYVSQACSSAEILACLFGGLLRLAPVEAPIRPPPFRGVARPGHPGASGRAVYGPPGPDLDRFFLSPTHYSLPLYAALIEAGRLHPDALDDYDRDGSSVEMIGAEHSPGMEVMTGSLGQGLGQALGIALGRRMKGENARTWVLLSDGELQIGMTWEGLQFAAHHRLDRVRIVVDVNGQQCDGTVDSVMGVEPAADRFEAFGAEVRVVDGHDVEALLAAGSADPSPGRPLVVLARTDPCRGLELMRRNAPRLHYLRFRGAADRSDYDAALAAMDR